MVQWIRHLLFSKGAKPGRVHDGQVGSDRGVISDLFQTALTTDLAALSNAMMNGLPKLALVKPIFAAWPRDPRIEICLCLGRERNLARA